MRKIMYIACLLGLLTFSACGKTDSVNVDNKKEQEIVTDNGIKDVQTEDKQEQSNDGLEPEEEQETGLKEVQEEKELLDYEIIKVTETVIDKTKYDFLTDSEDEVQLSFIIRVNDNWKKENGINGDGVEVAAGFPLEEGKKGNSGLDSFVGDSRKCILLFAEDLKDAEGVTTEVRSYAVAAEYLESFEMHFLKTNRGGNVVEGYIPAELPEEVSDIPERYILRGEYDSYSERIAEGYIVYLESNPYLMTHESQGYGGSNVNDEYYEVGKEMELIPMDVAKTVSSDFTGLQLVFPDEARESVQEYLAQDTRNEKLDMNKIRQEIKLYSSKEAREKGWTWFNEISQVYAVSYIYDYSNVVGFESYDKELGNLLMNMIWVYDGQAELVYENGEDSFCISN